MGGVASALRVSIGSSLLLDCRCTCTAPTMQLLRPMRWSSWSTLATRPNARWLLRSAARSVPCDGIKGATTTVAWLLWRRGLVGGRGGDGFRPNGFGSSNVSGLRGWVIARSPVVSALPRTLFGKSSGYGIDLHRSSNVFPSGNPLTKRTSTVRRPLSKKLRMEHQHHCALVRGKQLCPPRQLLLRAIPATRRRSQLLG